MVQLSEEKLWAGRRVAQENPDQFAHPVEDDEAGLGPQDQNGEDELESQAPGNGTKLDLRG